MFWVALFVPIGVVSIAVLGLLTWRLWRQVRQFGRDVAAAGERINRASEAIQQVSPRSPGR